MLSTSFRLVQRGVVPGLMGAALVLLASGCHREEVTAYEAPKDAPAAMPPGHGHGGSAADAASLAQQGPPRPGLEWKKLPTGWTSKGAAGMRAANFSLPGTGTGQAELGVIPLPGTGGGDLDLVNLWRGQLGLEPITEAQLATHTEDTTVAGQPVKIFSIVSTNGADAKAVGNQIVVVALRKEGFTWFFKLAGDTASVEANREGLKTFLGDLVFTAPAAAPAGAPAAPPAMAGGMGPMRGPFAGAAGAGAAPTGSQPTPTWQVPGGWKEIQAPQMVRNKWSVSGDGGSADITVSVFPGDTGGLSANLNRWRAQVGLQPAPDAELQALSDNLEIQGGKATLADFLGSHPESGQPVRLLAAVVRRDGWSWFYKMLGSPATIEAQREAFLKFLKTTTYSRGS